jgi:Phage late-transcription coactivator
MREPTIFTNAIDFSQYIETIAVSENQGYIATILQYCEERNLDPEDIAKYVSRSLKDKLSVEMQEDGLLPKTASLPFD